MGLRNGLHSQSVQDLRSYQGPHDLTEPPQSNEYAVYSQPQQPNEQQLLRAQSNQELAGT